MFSSIFKRSAKARPRGPDFLVIGAQRSGTSWLYLVLKRHPALWLPPVKEIHHFDRLSDDKVDDHKRWRRTIMAGRDVLDLWTLRYLVRDGSDDWYARLFYRAQLRGRIAGEITPAYATLGADMFRRIQKLNKRIKLAFIMRDPVDRAWSSVTNNATKRGMEGFLLAEKAISRARKPGAAARSAYIDTIERLESVFPASNLHFCFFDDLRDQPESFVASLLSFLQIDTREVKKLLLPPAKKRSISLPMPLEFKREMAETYLPMVRQLCHRFDGPPQRWLVRYERLLDGGGG